MKRADLEHVIRAAATIADDDELFVFGSQAVLGVAAPRSAPSRGGTLIPPSERRAFISSLSTAGQR